MIKELILMLLISGNVYAGISVCGDETKVTSFSLRGNPIDGCEYYDYGQNITGTEYDQIKTLLKTVPMQHLKMSNGVPVEMSEAEKTAVNDAMAAENVTARRTQAKNQLEGFGGITLYQRAVADVIRERENSLAGKSNAIIDCYINNSTAANIRSCIIALPKLLDNVTLSQVKTAIENKVDSGQVDN